jgi:hypothetical protein
LFSGEQATKASSFSLSGGIGEPTETLTRSLGNTSTTQFEAPKNTTKANAIFLGDVLSSGVLFGKGRMGSLGRVPAGVPDA